MDLDAVLADKLKVYLRQTIHALCELDLLALEILEVVQRYFAAARDED